jgi:hypothetical protein
VLAGRRSACRRRSLFVPCFSALDERPDALLTLMTC